MMTVAILLVLAAALAAGLMGVCWLVARERDPFHDR